MKYCMQPTSEGSNNGIHSAVTVVNQINSLHGVHSEKNQCTKFCKDQSLLLIANGQKYSFTYQHKTETE